MTLHHETFWVIVGTATPILALTNALASGTAVRTALVTARRDHPDEAALQETEPFELFKGSFMLAGAGFVLNFLTMVITLGVLIEEHDNTTWAWLALVFTLGSFALVGVQAFVNGLAEGRSAGPE